MVIPYQPVLCTSTLGEFMITIVKELSAGTFQAVHDLYTSCTACLFKVPVSPFNLFEGKHFHFGTIFVIMD